MSPDASVISVEYIRYRVPLERMAAFLAAYEEGGAVLRDDHRCLSYEVAQGHEEPDRCVVRIEWRSIEDHLQGFRASASFPAFFAAVRGFFDDIEEMKHYVVREAYRQPAQQPPTLFAWAGGEAAFARLIEAFYDRVEGDELIGPLFPGGVSRKHREAVTTWWAEVFGGPDRYTAAGGYPRMLARHRDLRISPEQRFRFVSLMSLAADDADLPSDPEFRAAFLGYVEWGTRLAMHNSQPGAEVVSVAPVPRWGWGVAPPYQG